MYTPALCVLCSSPDILAHTQRRSRSRAEGRHAQRDAKPAKVRRAEPRGGRACRHGGASGPPPRPAPAHPGRGSQRGPPAPDHATAPPEISPSEPSRARTLAEDPLKYAWSVEMSHVSRYVCGDLQDPVSVRPQIQKVHAVNYEFYTYTFIRSGHLERAPHNAPQQRPCHGGEAFRVVWLPFVICSGLLHRG